MGRGRKRRLSTEEELQVTEFLETNQSKKPEKKSSLARGFVARTDKQAELIQSIEENEITIAIGPSGTGKAQPLYSKVYTPEGPILMKDIKLGQEVCTPNGKTAIVNGIFPQGVKDCYRIYFTDSTTVDCCDEHLWKVLTIKDREWISENKHRSDEWFSILQTKDMIGSVIKNNRKNYKLPITKPVFYNTQNLPLDPYLIGALIGDGGMTSSNTIFSSKDQEILDTIDEIIYPLGLETRKIKSKVEKACDYVLARIDKDGTNNVNLVTRITGELGIRCKSEYKFIPKQYLLSATKDRIALLQGLMDTDGTVDRRSGCPSYSTSSLQLKDDFCELVRSLGGIATWSVKKTKCLDNYNINVNIPNNIKPFRLQRKQVLVIPKTKYLTPRYIENIEFIGQVEQQCISINSKEHLYITDNHVVTHNTFAAVATALSLLNQGYENIVLVKSVTTLPGEEIGFLKGSLSEKLDPFMMSFTWNIDKVGGKDTSKKLMEQNIIQVLPLAYIRGLSIDNSVVIIDESQNLTRHAFKSIMTRIGTNSKYVFLGDVEQIDRKKQSESCLAEVLDLFRDEDYIGTVEFLDEDCVRNPLIPKILDKLREKGI